MNRFSMILIAAVVSLSTVAAYAQSVGRVHVPFAFTANHQVLPAGTYEVKILLDNQFAVFFRNETGTAEGMLLVRPEYGSRIEPLGGLVFQSYGSRYALKEIRMPGSSTHRALAIQPKPEPLVAKNATNSIFEIAMR